MFHGQDPPHSLNTTSFCLANRQMDRHMSYLLVFFTLGNFRPNKDGKRRGGQIFSPLFVYVDLLSELYSTIKPPKEDKNWGTKGDQNQHPLFASSSIHFLISKALYFVLLPIIHMKGKTYLFRNSPHYSWESNS